MGSNINQNDVLLKECNGEIFYNKTEQKIENEKRITITQEEAKLILQALLNLDLSSSEAEELYDVRLRMAKLVKNIPPSKINSSENYDNIVYFSD